MIQRFDDELESLEVLAHGPELATVLGRDRDAAGQRVFSWPDEQSVEVATLSSPLLVTDHHRVAQLPPLERDTVFKLLESPRRRTLYRKTCFDFEQRRFPGTWGPSIDTLLLCKALRPEALRGVRRALEVGCGSGFISRYLLDHAPDLEQLTLVDIQDSAVRCAAEAMGDPRAEVLLADGLEVLRRGGWDLVVSNPPYVPREDPVADNPYEGVGLLVTLLRDGPRHLRPGGRVVVVGSSVGDAVVRPALAAEPTVLAELTVPFKVLTILNNPTWMRYLLARGLTPKTRDGYAFWHTVQIRSATAA